MKNPAILAYKGPTSQTGLAVKKEFLKSRVIGAKEKFDIIAKKLQTEAILSGLPMWNSHQGEIEISYALQMLFDKKARLYRIWPKLIQFEYLIKSVEKVKTIISVSVAQTQCSLFISRTGAKFDGNADSTNEAYDKFRDDNSFDAVLCAPGQNKDKFKVEKKDAANPLNFTSFVLLGGISTGEWAKLDWGKLYAEINPKRAVYFGVQMPIRAVSSSEDQDNLIEGLMSNVKTIDEIPKVLFIAKRRPGLCGLLIEAEQHISPLDILTEEGYSSEITIIPDIGYTCLPYPSRIKDLLNNIKPDFCQLDFIRHRGHQTCLYACLPLGIVTHGFEEDVVEPVVRQLINKYFDLYVNSVVGYTEAQHSFFEKYKSQFYEHGREFIKFVDIGLS